MTQEQIDVVGYLASFFVAISFLFKDIKTIRWVNLIGCMLFVVYGVMADLKPVIITNVFIVLVQVYYLFLRPIGKNNRSSES